MALATAFGLTCGCGQKAGTGADAGVTLVEGACTIPANSKAPEFLPRIPCIADFQALASEPLDSTLPGARSGKVVLDTADKDAVYFQNSTQYQIHYQFASTHLSGNGRPIVPPLAEFNQTEYYSPDRRFLLGAVTYYEGAKVWALEIAPYDTASAAMITNLYKRVKEAAFFGPALCLHPTSEAVGLEAKKLGSDVCVVTTDQLYGAIDYQPLALGVGVGRLRFAKAAELANLYVSFEDLLVLDEAPNDISVVQGIISQAFQTPLSHVNVLSQNRRTPNMGLRGAMTNPVLRALDSKLVELTVTASSWKIREVTQAEAEAFWAAHKPKPITLPALDLSVKGLLNIEEVTPEPGNGGSLRDALKKAILAFGGKAAHYSILSRTKDVPLKKAFAIPVYYYDLFMKTNKLYDRIDGFLLDPQFKSDSKVRDQKLLELRNGILTGAVDNGLQTLLKAKLAADYENKKMRFRTSTNSEDLDGFPCAGCYESHSGDPANWTDVLDAIREAYSSAWQLRTFEERSYYGIAHKSVGMALLVHRNFSAEEANGLASTGNPFDATGLDPAFYINVQKGGDAEVVAPPPGVFSDEFLYYFGSPNQPVVYISHSNLVPAGTSVLTALQLRQLGTALDAIHKRFSPAYGPAAGNKGWYGMEVDLKFDDEADPKQPPTLYIKQARPYPGRGQ